MSLTVCTDKRLCVGSDIYQMQTRVVVLLAAIAIASIGLASAQLCDDADRRDFVNCLRVADESRKLVPGADSTYHDIRFPNRHLKTVNEVCRHYTPLQDQKFVRGRSQPLSIVGALSSSAYVVVCCW